MQVIPSINAKNFTEAKNLIEKSSEFADWLHIDIGDGIFTPNVSWGNPTEFINLKSKILNLKTEVHLMIESPDAAVLPWLEVGAKRMILHVESIEDAESLMAICKDFQAEFGLAISPDTDIKELNVYFNKVNFYQILAVTPGLPGQQFKNNVLTKIKFLRQAVPDAIIEVDGGINLETAELVKKAGADIVVSASYIFHSPQPQIALEALKNI